MLARGDFSGIHSFNCIEYGHYKNNRPQTSDTTKCGRNGGNSKWKRNAGGGGNNDGSGVETA